MMDTKFLGVLFAFCHASVFAFDLSRLPVIQYVVPCRDACEARNIDSACSSRKGFITHVTQYALGSASFLLFPSTATAAGPITAKETDSLGVLVRRALRPKPPKILRQKLTQEFAVLLMRSSYNALDQLDCVAMDQFQRDFFLIRRSEYEPYVKALGPGLVQQGDLTDPYYFDFISFAQYETINREISENPPFVFEEQQPVEQGDDAPQKFVPVVIRRNPSLTNEMLGPEHSRLVGSAILDRLENIFGSTDSAIPKFDSGSRPDRDVLIAAVRQLMNLFLINGYAMGGTVSISSPNPSTDGSGLGGTQITILLNSPATLWGGKILQSEGAPLKNSFVLMTATELLKRAGYLSSSKVKYDGTSEEITITIA